MENEGQITQRYDNFDLLCISKDRYVPFVIIVASVKNEASHHIVTQEAL